MKILINMKRELYFGVVWLIVVSGLDSNSDLSGRDRLPCNQIDSINITSGTLNADKSITFNGRNYLPNRYAPPVKNGNIVFDTRGCLCDQMKCIRYCVKKDFPPTGFQIDVINANKEWEKKDFHEHFVTVRGINCPKRIATKFNIQDDGMVVPIGDEITSKHPRNQSEYCLKKNDDNEMIAEICEEPDDVNPKKFIRSGIGLLVSVPFLIATFLVYLFVPELRNLHGKCFLCYLLSLTMAFVPLAIAKISTRNEIPTPFCTAYAYTAYFSFISAFLWTSVISSDLWNSLGATVKYRFTSDKNQFYLYMIFAWGLSTLMTFAAFSADQIDFVPKSLQLKLGKGTCFTTIEVIPRIVYLFLPLCITFAMNIVFFILTALKIRSVRHELTKASSYDENSMQPVNFNTNTHSFAIYLRLIVVMGLNWIIEIIEVILTYVEGGKYEIIAQVLDKCNALMGVFTFGLFVLKPSVLHLIKKRWHFWFGNSSPNGSISSYASWVPPEHFVTDVKQR
ncbi:G-protein coupled receptor Mth2-like [Sitodiplosis mosellana]|uniref:G-protein coupled receptor Mth2-like n=1 Tax=Sitodiplosis mosellana TaxID=263140 RepID=UPI0024444876|nr:G-protein coupled receptor Mth2-like [Sitodiplosis mosellana]